MKILIGMLIHNEEDIIAKTLQTVFQQGLFANSTYQVTLIVIANACSDRSAEICRNELQKFKKITHNFNYRVVEKVEPGKIAAWNDFIHKYSICNENYIIMMDGDILIQQKNNFQTLVEDLEHNPHALISTDLPIKASFIFLI